MRDRSGWATLRLFVRRCPGPGLRRRADSGPPSPCSPSLVPPGRYAVSEGRLCSCRTDGRKPVRFAGACDSSDRPWPPAPSIHSGDTCRSAADGRPHSKARALAPVLQFETWMGHTTCIGRPLGELYSRPQPIGGTTSAIRSKSAGHVRRGKSLVPWVGSTYPGEIPIVMMPIGMELLRATAPS
jgi:hypothetical protein